MTSLFALLATRSWDENEQCLKRFTSKLPPHDRKSGWTLGYFAIEFRYSELGEFESNTNNPSLEAFSSELTAALSHKTAYISPSSPKIYY